MRASKSYRSLTLGFALPLVAALAACGDDSGGGPPSGGSGQGGAGQGGAGQGGAGQGGAPAGQGGAPGGAGGAPLPDPFSDLACGGAFCWQLPAVPGEDIYGVAAAGGVVFTVGAGGLITRRKDDAWKAIAVPGAPTLRAAWAAAEDDLWAVGDFGAVVHVDGSGVKVLPPPTLNGLRGIWGAASNNFWAVGDAGTFLHFDGVAWQSITSFGEYETPIETASALNTVWGTGPNDVWVGGAVSLYHFDGTRWNGSHGLSSQQNLLSSGGTGPDDVWLGGGSNIIYHRPPGVDSYELLDWTMYPLGPSEGNPLNITGIVALDKNDVWAFTGYEPWHWDGDAWTKIDTNAGTAAARSGDTLWSVNSAGHVYRLDAGANQPDRAPGRFLHAHVASDTNGLALGDFDHTARVQLQRWDGARWAPEPLPPGTPLLSGTAGGHTLLTMRTGASNDWTFTLTVYEDAGPTTLPPLHWPRDIFRPVLSVGGTSKSDLWAAIADELWHFDGSTWTSSPIPIDNPPQPVPKGRSISLTGPVIAYAPDDVWVGGLWSSPSTCSDCAYIAHYDGTSWTERSLSSQTSDSRPELPWLAATGPDQAYVGLYTEYQQPGDPEHPFRTPELYRWAGGWQSVALPNAKPASGGAEAISLAARDQRLYVGLRSAHPGVPKLLVREGEAWSSLEAPVFGVGAIYPTASSLWIESWNPYDYLASDPQVHYDPLYPFSYYRVPEHEHRGGGLLRLR